MKKEWYAVKILLHHPTRKQEGEEYLFEERITLWMANSYEEAYVKAEKEAVEYANESNSVFIQPVCAFHLFDENIIEGTEVYSIMRGSNLNPSTYRDTFCMTDRDRAAY